MLGFPTNYPMGKPFGFFWTLLGKIPGLQLKTHPVLQKQPTAWLQDVFRLNPSNCITDIYNYDVYCIPCFFCIPVMYDIYIVIYMCLCIYTYIMYIFCFIIRLDWLDGASGCSCDLALLEKHPLSVHGFGCLMW